MYYRKNSSTSMARGLMLSAVLTAFIALVLVHETCSATANAKVIEAAKHRDNTR